MATCIEVESYGHPGSHPPEIITQNPDFRFVTDTQIAEWNAKVDQTEFDGHLHSALSNPAGTVEGLVVDSTGSIMLINGVGINDFSTDDSLSGESNSTVPTERAVKSYVDSVLAAHIGYRLRNPDGSIPNALVIDTTGRATFPVGVGINRFSADETLASNSDDYVPTERAVKTYVDGEISDNAIDIAANTSDIEDLVTEQEVQDTAIANNATAAASNATDIGVIETAVGDNITAIGNNATAIGVNATAIGVNATDIGVVETTVGGHTTSISDAEDDIDDLEAKFTAGISQTLTFTGGASGAVATMTLVDGLVTAVTLVP